jgi:hypothetical protein
MTSEQFDLSTMLLDMGEEKKGKDYSFPTDNNDPVIEALTIAYNTGAVSPGNPCTVCNSNVKGLIRSHFHGSEFNSCTRKLYHDIVNPERRSEVGNNAFLLDGHTHEMLVLKCLERGLKLAKIPFHLERAQNNAELVVKSAMHMAIIGHYDGVLTINDERYIVECKAVKENTWKELLAGKVSDIWYGQMQFYMYATGIKKALLLVKNRVTSNLHTPIVVPYDHDFCKERMRILQEVWFTLQRVPRTPIPDRKFKNKNNKECRFCAHAQVCWSED